MRGTSTPDAERCLALTLETVALLEETLLLLHRDLRDHDERTALVALLYTLDAVTFAATRYRVEHGAQPPPPLPF